MLKKTLLFLLLAMPALWAYAQGNDVLQVDVKTTITLGKLDGNKRYLKPFVKVGDIYHAFYGCHVYDTVRVVPRANKLVDVQVYYGTSPCKGKIIGDSCVFVSDFEPECTQYNNIYAKITEDKGDTYNVPLNSLFIHPRPAIEKISYETTSTSDIDGLQFQKAVVHDDTGILTGWQYKWTEKKQNDTIAPTVIGTHQTIETWRKNDVAGDEKAYDEYDYRVICENVAPDNSTIWYSDTLSVMSVRYYNSPKAPKGIGRLNMGDKTIYYAAGMDMTDEELRNKAYWFSFDDAEEPTGSRYLVNPGSTPRKVRSVWKYTADVYKPVYIYSVAAVPDTIGPSLGPEIDTVEMHIEKGLNEAEKRYKGAVKSSDGRSHALVNSRLNCTVKLKRNNAKLTSATMIYGEMPHEPQIKEDCIVDTMTCLKEMVVDSIVMKLGFDVEVDKGQSMKCSAEFNVSNGFTIYPFPTFVKSAGEVEYTKQFDYNGERTDNKLKMNINVDNATGAAENWKYVWQTSLGKTKEPSSTAALNQSMECNSGLVAGDTMKTALDSIRLIYYDIAPDDKTRWITDTIAFPFRLYNVPSRPATLVKKGNYTSHFYIALMNESKFGNENVDEILKLRKYCFEYGNGQTEPKSYGKKTCADSTGYPQARWFDYTDQDDSNPWVQTYWDYLAIDEYPAHTSISEKTYAVSSRGDDDGTTAITSADISDSNDHLGSVLRIFDMNGRRLNSNDLNGLPSGIYIVETVRDGQMTRNKVIVN